jgi:hypothetical protein
MLLCYQSLGICVLCYGAALIAVLRPFIFTQTLLVLLIEGVRLDGHDADLSFLLA